MNDNRVFVTLDSRGRLVRFPSGLVVPAPERRTSRRLPATNHGARYQAEHPAPDGPPPTPPWEGVRPGAVVVLVSACVMLGAYGWSLACLLANDHPGAMKSSLVGVCACLAIAAVWGRGR